MLLLLLILLLLLSYARRKIGLHVVRINLKQCRSLEQFKHLLKTFLFSAWGHGTLWHFT